MQNDLKNLLIIDIETVSNFKEYSEMPERLQQLWDKKAYLLKNEDNQNSQDLYWSRAAIYAEFGRIIVISIGYFYSKENELVSLRVKSLSSHSEKELLEEFVSLLDSFDQTILTLCGHNGKEFDFPYLCRRLSVHQIPLPTVLDTSSKKPWEVNHIDTMEMWKFGDRKNFTSLDLLTAIFEIPSSKSDIDGGMVNQVYYNEDGLDRIAKYCTNDVIATAQLYLRMKFLPLIREDSIHIV
ncbi:MAG: 3'-5' exonuclease [Bacteroidetes bacterium]|nr:3'-5' exonuclease [Bacteroidota bacterium]MDA1120210.1 3'-5' exonuclease [Bacteroidota bacterium]